MAIGDRANAMKSVAYLSTEASLRSKKRVSRMKPTRVVFGAQPQHA